MVLIRVLIKLSSYKQWFKEDIEPEERIKDTFGFDESPVSVYKVLKGIDETRACAAHYLTYKRNHITNIYVLRMESNELHDHGITVNKTDGETGVAEIDAKHHDLIGTKRQFEDLAQHLHEAIRHGEDRLRTLESIQIRHQMLQFLHDKNATISKQANKYCLKALGLEEETK